MLLSVHHISATCWHRVEECTADVDYNGSLTVTDDARLCQRWQDKTPHYHNFDEVWEEDFDYFEIDGSIEAAENFCRNTGYTTASWCFTTNSEIREDYCHMRLCTARDFVCHEEIDLSRYSGNVSITDGARSCQPWSSQTPHAHPFNKSEFFPLDASVDKAENYCRNTGGDNLPWCFTSDEKVRWQYCYEQICHVTGQQCGGTLTESFGWLASIDRDSDNQYDDYRDCLWTIIAPKDMLVEIDFLMIDFNDESECGSASFIELYDDGLPSQLICDTKGVKQPPYRSNTGVLNVRIRTSDARVGKGVNISFTHVFPVEPSTSSQYSSTEGMKEVFPISSAAIVKSSVVSILLILTLQHHLGV